MTKIPFVAALLTIAGVVCASSVIAADFEAGKKKAETVCQACHGPEGNKPITPDIPVLAGQHYEYLLAALMQYNKGQRTNPMMMPMAKPLTVSEIEDVAWYFSKQQGLKVKY